MAPTSSRNRRRRPAGPGARTGGTAGFTLIEVTLALALIGLLAALALPRVAPGAGGAAALRLQALQIAALLRNERNAALRTGRPVTAAVDLGARVVRSGNRLRSVPLPETVAIRLIGDAAGAFSFFPDGTASGGELILARDGRMLRVRVNALTAAVDVMRGEEAR